MQAVQSVIQGSRIADLGPLPCPEVGPEAPLGEVVERLAEERRGAVVVMHAARARGIFTERDLLRLGSRALDSSATIADLMTEDPVTVSSDSTILHAIQTMHDRGCRHLVVEEDDEEVTGLLTSQDLIDHITQHFPREVVNLPPSLKQHFDRPEGG